MDLSQYAELFLAESREHWSACNHLLLEWERSPANPAPVAGLFRAVHTVKGMAATMGYARVTDLAHRTESLLDALRRGARPADDALLQLLFRARDALARAVELSVAGREEHIDVAEVTADLDRALVALAPPGEPRAAAAVPAVEPGAPAAGGAPSAAPGHLVEVTLRAEAPLKGARAALLLQRAQGLGAVHGIVPPAASFEAEDFDGRFRFRLATSLPAAEIERALRAAGDVETVRVGATDAGELGDDGDAAGGGAAGRVEGGRSRHVRVDLRRLDALMNLIGELVTGRASSGSRSRSAWRGRRSSSTAPSWTSSGIRSSICCATRWTTASSRRPSGGGGAKSRRGRSCSPPCASAPTWRSPWPTTAGASIARRSSSGRSATGWWSRTSRRCRTSSCCGCSRGRAFPPPRRSPASRAAAWGSTSWRRGCARWAARWTSARRRGRGPRSCSAFR